MKLNRSVSRCLDILNQASLAIVSLFRETPIVIIALAVFGIGGCALEDGLTGLNSNSKPGSGSKSANGGVPLFDFEKECGLPADKMDDKNAILVKGAYTSFPMIVEGTSMGTAFRVITQAKLTLSATSGASNQSISVALLESSSGAGGVIGWIATPIVKAKAQKATNAASGTVNSVSLPKKDWLKLTGGTNPEYKDLLCAASQNQTVTKSLGGGTTTYTYSPTLVSGISPLAPVEQMRKEFGSGKSLSVTATVQGGAAVAGHIIIKEVAATLEYAGKTITSDIAFEFINDFPGGSNKVGLPRRQVFFIDATKKEIVAIINEDDTIDESSGKVRPPAVFVKDP